MYTFSITYSAILLPLRLDTLSDSELSDEEEELGNIVFPFLANNKLISHQARDCHSRIKC